jgi:translation initiation factor 3 subunit C
MGSRFFRKADDSDSDSESSDEESLTSGDEAPKPPAAEKPKSRFLRSGGSSDSGSPSEEEDSDSSEEERKPTAATSGPSAYPVGSDDEDSDEEVKRVVKSAKDKRLEDMETTGNVMNNALKINDWTAIATGRFESSFPFATEE